MRLYNILLSVVLLRLNAFGIIRKCGERKCTGAVMVTYNSVLE